METVIKYIWLAMKGIAPRKVCALLDSFSSIEDIYLSRNYTGLANLKSKEIELLADKSLKRAENVYRRCIECGVRIITIEDANYPQLLKETDAPPIVLYAKGQMLDLNKEFCVGIVGTRQSTSYGERVTMRFGTSLAMKDIVIVSGLALGIDSIAARAAVRQHKPTLAVLGCGIDIVYPQSNRQLYAEVEKYGMIISEYPPGTPPATWTFPRRNRIIAGLSKGVIIVEGSKHSGSLITANFALDYNRDIFAVPRNIDEVNLDGTNHLIKQGAIPMTCIEDLIEYYPELENRAKTLNGEYFSYNNEQLQIEETVQTKSAEKEPIKFSLIKRSNPEEEKILQAIGDESLHIDKLVEKTGMAVSLLGTKLIMLEIEGVVEQLPGKFYRIK